MRTHAQAVVIGGGVIGCSILYHLTKLGWTDVLLLERNELTSGSTWHAAANIHGLHDSTNISRIQHYTMNLYNELEAETGQSCGVFQPGSLYLAQTENREHQLRLQAAKAKFYGMNFYEVTRDEAERLHPLVDYEGVRCIMFEPEGGNVDPSGVTNAYAAGARARGAEIHRFTPVIGTEQQEDGSWIVRTPNGDIHTKWIVNAAGLWGREVAALAGITLPLQPTEHQYFVTETIAEIAAMEQRLPSVADRDGEYYLRQEGQGLLIGAYEKDLRFWAEEGTPINFAHELFADDLDRIEDNMMRAIRRVPALGTAGIKRVINGPMIWSPDSNVLYGPHPDLRNYFCCNGIIPGFSQSGGMGLMSAQANTTCSLGMLHDLATGLIKRLLKLGSVINMPTALPFIFPMKSAKQDVRCAPVPSTRYSRRWAACLALIMAGSMYNGFLTRLVPKIPMDLFAKIGLNLLAANAECCGNMPAL